MKSLIKATFVALLLMTACHRPEKNPLLAPEPLPYNVPAFDRIRPEHYKEAFAVAVNRMREEIDEIANNPEEPTFQNTLEAYDRAGALLQHVEGAFFNVLEADGSDEMDEIAEHVQPGLTLLADDIMLNKKLFQRIKKVYDEHEQLDLNDEQMRLLTETYRAFVMRGANLSEEKQQLLREINQELDLLSLQFGRNVVAETNDYKYFVTDENDLRGLPQSAKQAAKEEAINAGRPDAWLFLAKRTSFTPVLQYCENRDLRRELLLAYTTRCNHGGEHDNKPLIQRTMALRVEKAQLFGFETPADYILQDAMAHNAKNAYDLLLQVWQPSLEAAKKEAAERQALLEQDLPGEKLQPWDWWYYTEKLRKQKYDLNEEQLKPYFELSNVRRGVFGLATKLYGLQFEPINDLPVYNKEVEVFRVTDTEGKLVGILYTDYFPRAGKRPGAWMNNICNQYVDAQGIDHRPVIVNVGNFNKPTKDNPSLLSMDDVETMFHEFGHALHGLLSRAHYQSLSGTNVPRDFVEMPSQIMENFCYEPEVMRTYAFHYKTGELIPDSLIEKINRQKTFNQGFVETELLSASILDLDYHLLTDTASFDVEEFERKSLEKMGMIPQIIVRYRSTFFNHIFTTGYEAGYYSYTWSAVLDADAFAAFKEKGDIFDPQTGEINDKETAQKFRHLLEQGGTRDAQDLWQEFRSRPADPKFLLQRKGFIE
ncbi:MAG: M3 family metallopeptidase [Paludibacteraceae bacterium]|nr:M3 family metallopeptidase [Paludibacteraceae bacterium]